MNLAFIVDPLDSLKPHKDSTVAMMREAFARGHSLYCLQQDGIWLQHGLVMGFAQNLQLTGETKLWYALGKVELKPLNSFDVVLMRKDPPFDMEYLYSTYLLELAEKQGGRIFNHPQAIRDFNEKLSIAKFSRFTPSTLVARQAGLIREFLAEHGDIVLKPLDGMGGAGVFRVHSNDKNINVIIETLTQHGKRTIMAQRYIPAIEQGDKRVLVIHGEPAPYALARIPMAGEHRGNLAAGGKGVAQALSDRDREIALALGPVLRDAGLLLVGLDIIGDYLTEINVTSPTCMREIADQTGFNVAAMAIDALERMYPDG
jgi:glutathione synthase